MAKRPKKLSSDYPWFGLGILLIAIVIIWRGPNILPATWFHVIEDLTVDLDKHVLLLGIALAAWFGWKIAAKSQK